ncbi:MAG: hypothetical protein FK732_02395, partial [Asgard group archaeon]|nr:hypothetical protein [Asgard group archaeon]
MSIPFDNNLGEQSLNKELYLEVKIDHNIDVVTIQAAPSHIYITGSNWSQAIVNGWVTGSGTSIQPYVIKDFEINAENSTTGSGIFIENSVDYFIIENCTV